MRSPKKKIDLERLDAGSFTIADAMGLPREPARPTESGESCAGSEAALAKALGSSPLRLFLERKGRNGKNVTRLTGLPPGEESARLVRKLKQNLGCAASTEGEDICFQGDQRARLLKRLKDSGARDVKIV